MEGQENSVGSSEANLDLDYKNMNSLQDDVADNSRPDNITPW